MADPSLRGLAYAHATLKDLRNRFKRIMILLNNDEVIENLIWENASKGEDQAKMAIDSLDHQKDLIKIYIDDGQVSTIHGCPPGFEIEVINKDLGTRIIHSNSDIKLIS